MVSVAFQRSAGNERAVQKDKFGMKSAKNAGRRIVERCRVIKAGKIALGEYPVYLEPTSVSSN